MRAAASGIECAGVTRRFKGRTALDGVSLGVSEGQLVVLLGSNGAGKTTLMKILATLLLPDEGVVRLGGMDVLGEPEAARRLIGFVPAEERSFFGRLTVRQNLEFFAALRGLSARECRARSEELLAEVGLEGREDTRFAELSSGMRQSLSLVRGLLHRPPVLLLDEPTRSLSPDLAHRVQLLLKRRAAEQACTTLFATHNLAEAEVLADRVAILHEGRIVADGPLAELCEGQDGDGGLRLKEVFHRAVNPGGGPA